MAAAADDEAWAPPLLSWKGLQMWSIGCRAPGICQMFMGFKAKTLPSLVSSTSQKKNKAKRRKRRDGDLKAEPTPAHDMPPPRCSSLQFPGRFSCRSSLDDVPVPQRHSISFEPSTGRITNNQLRRNSDATASSLKRISDHLKRNSDASVGSFSTSSPPPCGGYERVGVDGVLDKMLPRDVKLGGRRSDVSSVHMGRQDSGVSAHRRSACSSFSSSSSVASAASTAVKLASRRSSESEQQHLSELLVGNQFLTHLTAAPVATAMPQMCPSDGFLLDASVRCREAELKDRIIFFL